MELNNLQKGYRELKEELQKLKSSNPVVIANSKTTGIPTITINNYIPTNDSATLDSILTDLLDILDILVKSSNNNVIHKHIYKINTPNISTSIIVFISSLLLIIIILIVYGV